MPRIIRNSIKNNVALKKWKILLIDDEPDVHNITMMVLQDFEYKGKGLEFLTAYSAFEAKEIISSHPDIALIILDVVMETDNAGLELVEYIRKDMQLKDVRIILRTGQPGIAPERYVIDNYDINEYKTKSELTSQKLYTTVRSGLKNFSDIQVISYTGFTLEKIIEASASILKLQSKKSFIQSVMNYFIEIIKVNLNSNHNHSNISAFTADCRNDEDIVIIEGTGTFKNKNNQKIIDILPQTIFRKIEEASKEGINYYGQDYSIFFFPKETNNNIIFINGFSELSEWSRKFLDIFWINVSIGFANISLKDDIEETQKEIIFMLGTIGESRSKETANHVKRVAEYSRLFAQKYGLSKEDVEIIRLASPMHDIGKVGIPDDILKKSDKLEDKELEIMKGHSTLGYDLLKGSNQKLFQVAAILACDHHERYDGTGYPNGAKGEDIHIFARITAIADVFDALGSDRCYKKAWKINMIIDFMKKERGRHFDPVLVDILIANIDEFINIRNTYKDVASLSAVS